MDWIVKLYIGCCHMLHYTIMSELFIHYLSMPLSRPWVSGGVHPGQKGSSSTFSEVLPVDRVLFEASGGPSTRFLEER